MGDVTGVYRYLYRHYSHGYMCVDGFSWVSVSGMGVYGCS